MHLNGQSHPFPLVPIYRDLPSSDFIGTGERCHLLGGGSAVSLRALYFIFYEPFVLYLALVGRNMLKYESQSLEV